MRKKVERQCIQCGKNFGACPCKIAKGEGKYCSRRCAFDAQIVYQERECEYCGKKFSGPSQDISKYCSKECGKKGFVAIKTKQVDCVCANCGITFKGKLSDVKRGGGKYCSRACTYEASRQRIKKVDRTCLRCGKSFEVNPCTLTTNRGKYCSNECKYIDTVGAKNHAWRGGRYEYYGPNWNTQRNAAYERDGGTCQVCHRKPRKNESRFQVHHIQRLRSFNGDFEAANNLLNLITLCPHCHPKAEHNKILVPARLL